MEGNAARIGVGNAGIDVDNILSFQIVFQCLIENGARAGAPRVFGHIDGGLHSPVIGSPFLKFRCIGISQDASVPDGSQIRVPFQGGGDAVLNSRTVGTLYSKVMAVFPHRVRIWPEGLRRLLPPPYGL